MYLKKVLLENRNMSRYTKYPQGIDQKLPIPPSMKNDIVLTPNHEALHANSMKQPFSLTVDSRDRNIELYPNPNNYVIQTPRYKDVLSVELIGADVPHSGFNIDNSNNVIHMIFTSKQFLAYYNGVRENGKSYIEAVIPPGNYEAGDLAGLKPDNYEYGRNLIYQSYYDVNGPQRLAVNTGIVAEAMWLAIQNYINTHPDDPDTQPIIDPDTGSIIAPSAYSQVDFMCNFDLKSMRYTIMSNAKFAIVTRERDRNVANQPIPNFFINQTSAQAGDSFLGINNDRFQPLNRSAYEVLGFKLQNYFPFNKYLYEYVNSPYNPGTIGPVRVYFIASDIECVTNFPVGDTLEITLTILPANAINKILTFQIDDTTFAQVNSFVTGENLSIATVIIEALSEGYCELIVSATDGSGETITIPIFVTTTGSTTWTKNTWTAVMQAPPIFSLVDGAFDRSNPDYIQIAEGTNYYFPPLYPISQGAGGQYTNNYNPEDPCDVSLTGLDPTVNIIARCEAPNYRYDGGKICCYSLPNRPNLNGEKYIILDIPELNYRDLTSVKNNQFYCRILFDTPINITTLASYYNSGVFPAVTNLASTNTVKSIKGSDIGNNRCIKYFTPTQGVLAKLTVRWLKYDGTPYDFQGQDHAIHLEILTVKQTGTYFS